MIPRRRRRAVKARAIRLSRYRGHLLVLHSMRPRAADEKCRPWPGLAVDDCRFPARRRQRCRLLFRYVHLGSPNRWRASDPRASPPSKRLQQSILFLPPLALSSGCAGTTLDVSLPRPGLALGKPMKSSRRSTNLSVTLARVAFRRAGLRRRARRLRPNRSPEPMKFAVQAGCVRGAGPRCDLLTADP